MFFSSMSCRFLALFVSASDGVRPSASFSHFLCLFAVSRVLISFAFSFVCDLRFNTQFWDHIQDSSAFEEALAAFRVPSSGDHPAHPLTAGSDRARSPVLRSLEAEWEWELNRSLESPPDSPLSRDAVLQVFDPPFRPPFPLASPGNTSVIACSHVFPRMHLPRRPSCAFGARSRVLPSFCVRGFSSPVRAEAFRLFPLRHSSSQPPPSPSKVP